MHPDAEKIVNDIKSLKIQGARTIAKSALEAELIQAEKSKAETVKQLLKELKKLRKALEGARATEPALRNYLALLFMEIEEQEPEDVEQLKEIVKSTSERIKERVWDAVEKVKLYGSRKVPKDGTVLVHCHSHTVVGVLTKAWESGKKFEVYSTETRPKYQGRKTASELADEGIPVTQIVDSAAASVMKRLDLILVGSDAITSEGAVINKIGTKAIAIAANYYGIPFYVCSETFKVDPITRFGFLEEIEERDPKELGFEHEGVEIYNPAFDVTPAKLIHGIITEKGIIPPQEAGLFSPLNPII